MELSDEAAQDKKGEEKTNSNMEDDLKINKIKKEIQKY